ncbi:hypothetical protein RRG08_005993 [Elysia crispata]|uniref:Uncharacterized protein n=1 Tax=Elysia crispata TaxID=231223 RepID=A0AAE0XUI0_9GAST|nr:hypothetical protein RRG08_005993 [Elysia crispata]
MFYSSMETSETYTDVVRLVRSGCHVTGVNARGSYWNNTRKIKQFLICFICGFFFKSLQNHHLLYQRPNHQHHHNLYLSRFITKLTRWRKNHPAERPATSSCQSSCSTCFMSIAFLPPPANQAVLRVLSRARCYLLPIKLFYVFYLERAATSSCQSSCSTCFM